MNTASDPSFDTTGPAASLGESVHRGWLHDMARIREFEVRTMQAYQNKAIGGFCHIYIGQEAVAVGCMAAVEDSDPVVTAYRDHGHALARGMSARMAMAEMYGRMTGCAKGKGGSMHLFDREHAMYGGHGIVGAQIPLGAGLAFATRYEDEVIGGGTSTAVTLCFFGDGALNQGSYHEALNLAGIFDLPILFICENNGYSMGTSITRGTTMAQDITAKAAGYGMKSAVIEGMNVMQVYDGMKPLVDECRATCRPVFVDMRTYRFKGHSMSDPRKYRSRDEEAQYEAVDPIETHRRYLEQVHGMTQDEWDAMRDEIKAEVRDAVSFSDGSPHPPLSELYHDVFVESWGPYTGSSTEVPGASTP